MENEVRIECKRFIESGNATTVINNGNFYTTYIDPFKIAQHFVEWQKQRCENKSE